MRKSVYETQIGMRGLSVEGCRVALHFAVPRGSAPEIGRIRPDKIGDPADVDTAQSMYPSIIPRQAKTTGREPEPRCASQLRVAPQPHVGVLTGSLPEVLWRGPEAARGGRHHDRGQIEPRFSLQCSYNVPTCRRPLSSQALDHVRRKELLPRLHRDRSSC